ncbi:MAG: adenylate/guanylate cyclase domain-containing protein [Stellaceae bacterium]
MPVHPVERKLAAIFAADIAGYSRLMARDEVGTVARLKACRAIVDELIAEHRGRIFNTAGDSVIADFASAVDAVQCAVAVQTAIAGENSDRAADESMQFRIGVHVGDVMVDGENLLGDGVNIAARLEGLAKPGAIYVSAVVRDQVGNKLPLAFDDLGDQQVKNIAEAIRVYRVRKAVQPYAALPLPDKPSIAVLPFQNMSGDPEQEYFVDGMVEEIITALSRIRWLFVIARNSSFTYKGQAVDVKQVGRELGVRYVLEGSVRKGGNRVRITAQLIDAETGAHLWADRFDGLLEDVFDLQDKVASSVAGVIEPTLRIVEISKSASRRASDLSAYDLYLRGLPYLSWGHQQVMRGLGMFEEAIARDPNYGPALAAAAHCRLMLAEGGWVDDGDANRTHAVDLAREALRAAPGDPNILATSAGVIAYFGAADHDTVIALIQRALALNPSSARGWNWNGWLMQWAGQSDLAIEHFEKSMRLTPHDGMGLSFAGIGGAHFVAGRFEDAVGKLMASLEELPSFTFTYRVLASALAHLGELEEAGKVIERLRTLTPIILPLSIAFRKPEHRELLLSGLRLAMGETE